MVHRFFVDSLGGATTVVLSGAEAHHLMHVRRMVPGEALILFDGQGKEYDAVIKKHHSDSVELTLRGARTVDREVPGQIVLAVALPKGDRQRFLIEKAVEIGVHALVPLITQRGTAIGTPSAIQRMERWVVEAGKQCGRTRLMKIETPRDLNKLFADFEGIPHRWLADPSGAPFDSSPFPQRALAIVGPEGGFTEQECSRAVAGNCQRVRLGARVLRVETAALCLATVLASQMEHWSDRYPRDTG